MEVNNINNTFIHTQVIYFVPKLVSTYIFYDNFKISSHIPNCTGNYNIWSKLVLIRRIPGKIAAALFACLESATQETVEDDAPGLSPDHLGPINQQIKALCEERGLYYLDLNAEFSDENGYLLTDYAQPDGIHLTVSGYNKWVSYLCTHTPYSKNNPYQSGSTYYLSKEMQSQLADLP